MFITMLPHLDPMMFYLATQQNAQTNAVAGAEKTAFAWWDCLSMLHLLLHYQRSVEPIDCKALLMTRSVDVSHQGSDLTSPCGWCLPAVLRA